MSSLHSSPYATSRLRSDWAVARTRVVPLSVPATRSRHSVSVTGPQSDGWILRASIGTVACPMDRCCTDLASGPHNSRTAMVIRSIHVATSPLNAIAGIAGCRTMSLTAASPAVSSLFRSMLVLPQVLYLSIAQSSIDDLVTVDERFGSSWVAALPCLKMIISKAILPSVQRCARCTFRLLKK